MIKTILSDTIYRCKGKRNRICACGSQATIKRKAAIEYNNKLYTFDEYVCLKHMGTELSRCLTCRKHLKLKIPDNSRCTQCAKKFCLAQGCSNKRVNHSWGAVLGLCAEHTANAETILRTTPNKQEEQEEDE